MKRMHISIPQLAAGLLVAALCLSGCGGQELVSTWCEKQVSIDGQDSEWQGTMAYLDDAGVAIGLMNDEDYLYLCLATVDSRVVQQVAGAGLTVWFDPGGGKKQTFGIQFPLGMSPSSMDGPPESRSMSEPGDGGPPESRSMSGPGEGGPDPDRLRQMLEESAQEMVILGPEKKESRRMPIAGSQEVKVKVAYNGGKLVYELRVPLVRDLEHPDAVGLKEGRRVGLGFETAEVDRRAMRKERRSGGPPGGGMDGGGPPMGGGMRGGGMPGGRGPGGSGEDRQEPEHLELWAKILLAGGEDAASL